MKSNVPALYPNAEVGAHVLEYAARKSNEIPQALVQYHASITDLEHSVMSISTYQAQAMSFLAKITGAKRVLEVGVFRGFSTMVWAHAVGPDGSVTGLEFSPEYAAFAKKAIQDHGYTNIDVVECDALQYLETFTPDEPYDILFIDAQKWGYPGYLETLLRRSQPGAAQRLLRPGGLIIADNVLRCGVVADASPSNPASADYTGSPSRQTDLEALERFNTMMRESDRIDAWLVPLFDGVGMGRLLD